VTQPQQTFQDTGILRMFPTVVWRGESKPETHRPLDEQILAALWAMDDRLSRIRPGDSWQSGHRLHELHAFSALVSCVDVGVEHFLASLNIAHSGFTITGCWANVSAPGAGHPLHSHPNNYLSGVYYVRVHAGADTIHFHDPRPQTAVIRPPVTGLTADNADQVTVQVKDGTLLLFPAWLEHSVDPNRSAQTRVSVSFNVMFQTYTARMSPPGWTGGWRHLSGD